MLADILNHLLTHAQQRGPATLRLRSGLGIGIRCLHPAQIQTLGLPAGAIQISLSRMGVYPSETEINTILGHLRRRAHGDGAQPQTPSLIRQIRRERAGHRIIRLYVLL